MGIPASFIRGLMWCVVFGVARGCMYSSQKIAQDVAHVKWEHMLLIRQAMMMIDGSGGRFECRDKVGGQVSGFGATNVHLDGK